MEPLKERVKQLMVARDAMEREINERLARLDAPGGGGRTGSLVDAEGFPRTDVDVYAVREDRHRVAVLTNDHKAVSDQIHEALAQLHDHARSGDLGVSATELNETTGMRWRWMPVHAHRSKPPRPQSKVLSGLWAAEGTDCVGLCSFAVVDSVSPDSPASEAGIECGDELCQFGAVVGRPGKNDGILTRLAAALKAAEGETVETIFLRNGATRKLQLTPHRWGGPGLIGCHLRPLLSQNDALS